MIARGVWILQRDDGALTEVITLSLWDSLEVVKGFAGDNISRARFYPEDDRYVVERDLTVRHCRVTE